MRSFTPVGQWIRVCGPDPLEVDIGGSTTRLHRRQESFLPFGLWLERIRIVTGTGNPHVLEFAHAGSGRHPPGGG